MRCISVSEFGGPAVLRLLNSLPSPAPNKRLVLINVKAAGVNPVDTYIRSGTYLSKPTLPYTPGKDGAGVVQQVGDEVTKVKKGDRVWFCGSQTGSYSEYCLCHENNICQLPVHIPFEDGAMLGTPYLTAARALMQKSHLTQGMTVLIHGATGGVGTAAVQICKSVGANVVATAGSQAGVELLSKMGVDRVYNHREPGYIQHIKKEEEGRIDVILEMLANVNLQEDLKIISHGGTILVIGSRGPLEIDPRSIMTSECTVTGFSLFKSTESERKDLFDFVNKGVQDGWLRPVLWKSFELAFASDAHRIIIENSGAQGQIVLKIEPSAITPEWAPTDL